jgi:hypothetical protein
MTQGKSRPTQFDGYEISGVAEYGSEADRFCEQVEDTEAQFWSLYGHVSGEGVICIRITGHSYRRNGGN